MNNKSIWENYKIKNINNQVLDTKTDILIIGAGITGLSVAYFLKDSKNKITIIDKSKIGMGVTSKTTAKISFIQQLIYQDLEKAHNINISKEYLNSGLDAINYIKEIIKKENIECDFTSSDSYLFTTNNDNIEKIKKEKNILEKFNIKCEEINKLPIKFPIKYGIKIKGNYTFHPLKYLNGIKNSINKNINIYENITAFNIIPKDNYYIVETSNGNIISKYVVVSTHYPFFIKPGFIPLRTYMKREYVNSSEYKNIDNFQALNVDKQLHSIRFYKNNIIYGSNEHRLTSNINYQDNYNKSRNNFKKLFSKEPKYTWMNQDITSNDLLPFIGRYNNLNKNLFIACGYNAWGMTNGTIAGKIISDLINNTYNKYTNLFNPLRINTKLILDSILGVFHYSKIYLQTEFNRNPSFYKDYVKVIRINGINYGIYYDKDGIKHIVKNKCPHMKCNLIFNNEEKTWDCPCHGSRFNIDGDVLEGPSTYNIRTNF